MKAETHYSNGKTTTFIVADNATEAEHLNAIAPISAPLVAVLEPKRNYLYPYLKIVYKGKVT